MKLNRLHILTPPFDAPLAGAAMFHVYTIDAAGLVIDRIATAADADRSLDLAGLLDEGTHRLAVTRQDLYGTQSVFALANRDTGLRAIATIEVTVGEAGEVVRQLVQPQITSVVVEAEGMIAMAWRSVDLSGTQQAPAEWEIAEASDLNTIIETIPAGRHAIAGATVGPFADTSPTSLALRASDGILDGQRSPWVYATAVTVDLTPPPVPMLVT